MSHINLAQIERKLRSEYLPKIDLSDCRPNDAEQTGLSRALAAFALAELADLSVDDACAAITDGYGDNGIDALSVDVNTARLVVVQSKWDNSGRRSPQYGEVLKFITGVKDLSNASFERFNAKLRRMEPEIAAVLENPDFQMEVVIAYTGTSPLSQHALGALQGLLDSMNDVSPMASLTRLDQARFWEYVRRGTEGHAPNLDAVMLQNWGLVTDPYKAVYGQVGGATIAKWWSDHRGSLFDSNLRKPLPDSSVNEGMVQTLKERPENFWYFNNGITVLCRRMTQSILGGAGREVGSFLFEEAQVVNGAQTVSSIGRAAEVNPEAAEAAKVYVRFISLEGCPDEFGTEVTRATNTQNRILARDFVAISGEQERLQAELALEGKVYALKSGEADPPKEQGCTVDEATIALACAHSLDLAVQAKRERGKLWEDIEKPPYTDIFNASVSGTRLWRAVEVLRQVDEALRSQLPSEGRDRLIGIHANRLVAHLVFRQLPPGSLDDPTVDFAAVLSSVSALTDLTLRAVWSVMSSEFPNSYPTPTFKSPSRSGEIADLALVILGI